MGKFVLKVYRVWYDYWKEEYKKPSLDFAWPIVDSIKIEKRILQQQFSFEIRNGLERQGKIPGFSQPHAM